ncbi:MAG: 30S ribosomal protein S6 [Clostridia bacterium]|nr:30S ribosomal protein S6 [Anaerotignum sp.]NCC16198.1 30S ribosomal protein S6 [Clostridia bacterium]
MNKYELAMILSPVLDEEGRVEEVAKIQATLERFGAKIEKVDDWGKRKLAYEIKKVNEGFYSFTAFEAPADAPAEIEARLRIMESVLRYLIIRKEA